MTTGNESIVYIMEDILNDDDDWVGVKTEWIDNNTVKLLVNEVDGPLEINGKRVKKIIIEFIPYEDQEDE